MAIHYMPRGGKRGGGGREAWSWGPSPEKEMKMKMPNKRFPIWTKIQALIVN